MAWSKKTAQSALPAECMVFAPSRDGPIVGWARFHEEGIKQSKLRFTSNEEADAYTSFINALLGVTRAQSFSMLVGSFAGWDHPKADPEMLPSIDPRFRKGVGSMARRENH